MDIQEILRKKRDGLKLTSEEIIKFVTAASNGKAHDSQIGAMLMAMVLKGLDDEETVNLTEAMIKSGKEFEWKGLVADKHSTGGVGDKVSIVLAPALACCGLKIPMLSGRSLEFTGGTLDKLESIPGFNVNLNEQEMDECLDACGCFIAAPTQELCPADRVLYKIRDVTATVDFSPLVTASILSKKIAEGAKNIILDVKVGQAAFFKTVESAKELGSKMMMVASKLGVNLKVALTRMDDPIGKCIGNGLEISECVEMMKGGGPADLRTLILTLGGELLHMCGKSNSPQEGQKTIDRCLENGECLKQFKLMLINQGVEECVLNSLIDNPWLALGTAKLITQLNAPAKGWIESIDALTIAKVTRELGATRKFPGEKISHGVGVILKKQAGDTVVLGEMLLSVHHNEPLEDSLIQKLASAFSISLKKPLDKNIIIDVLK